MSRRNRQRAILPGALETPEGQAPIETPETDEPLDEREEEDGQVAEEQPEPAPVPPPAAEPSAGSERRARLAAARALRPDAAHWATVWAAGRDAAVSALDGGASIADAHALRPPDAAGCRDCWRRGRDAALRVIQGV